MIRFLALLILLCTATPAMAGPLAAIVPIVVGVLKVSALVKIGLTLAATVAMSMLNKGRKQRNPGITIETTLQGGTNPRTIMMGLYATAGSEATPPMSYGGSKKTPNANLVKVIALADYPVDGLSRVIINGEYIPLSSAGSGRYNLGGKYAGKGNVIFYDGRQTTADAATVAVLNSYPNRPWSASRIGIGVSYAIFTFNFDAEVYKGEPDVRVELRGARLYDVRKDTTAGGSGGHRWGQPETYEFTNNNIVMIYNILRGITLADGTVYGGDCDAEDLPTVNWAAAMNVCDETVTTIFGPEPRYRAGIELTLDEEPADVIEELLKGCSGDIVEVAGAYKVRAGPPGLPVMFITDESWIITKEQELDPFPAINGSFNTIHAVFPHPEEVWQQHDAPRVTNPSYVTRDEGQELVASLAFPACPYPIQVQRNMLAWLEDDQRWRRHTGVLSHRGFALEPLDTIAWTSTRNSYIDKLFEISMSDIVLPTLLNSVAVREVDPDDYNWNSGDELPDPVGNGGWLLPEEQAVEEFAVAPWSIKDADSDDRRPAIRCTWDIEGAIDAFAIRIEVRLAATQEAVAGITVANVGEGSIIISEGILAATGYEVRARYLVDRATLWTVWHGITTGNILLTEKDFDFDSVVEALGPSMVIPQIMRPAKDTIIQGIIDAAHNDLATREANTLVIDAFAGVFGNTASITNEVTARIDGDEAVTKILTVQISRIDDNAAAIVTESITRADEDSALASSINALGVTVGDNTAAISQEATTRANADTALAADITTLTTTVGDNTADITQEATTRANADTALAADITTLTSTVGDNTSAISQEAITRASADDALAVDITTLTSTVGDNTAAISTEATTRADADTALASNITTVTARLNNAGGTGVTVEQAFTATASDIDGLEGQYTLRINNNGRISGFGLASGVGGSEFSILADRFIVVDPANNTTAAYPFQVVGGAVYIRKAFIQQITADQLDVNQLSAVSATIGDLDIRPTTGNVGRIRIFDESDNLRVVLGRLT